MLVIIVNSDRSESDRVELRSIVRSSTPGATTTPVDLAWSYHPANPVTEKAVAPHVIWNATVAGSITAPDTASVSSYTEPYQWENQRRMMACVPNTSAFTVEMEAALTATSSELEGQAPHPTIEGAVLEWRYSNPHVMILQNEPSGSVTGSGVTFTIPVVKGANFGRIFGACVAYDLQTWVINPDGTRSGGGVSPDLCQTTFVLDLRVGNPPPGCPGSG